MAPTSPLIDMMRYKWSRLKVFGLHTRSHQQHFTTTSGFLLRQHLLVTPIKLPVKCRGNCLEIVKKNLFHFYFYPPVAANNMIVDQKLWEKLYYILLSNGKTLAPRLNIPQLFGWHLLYHIDVRSQNGDDKPTKVLPEKRLWN